MTASRSLSISTDAGVAQLPPKARQALDAMVFKGLRPAEVQAHANVSERTVYRALASPAGRRYYEHQLQVLRSGERARNIGTAIAIRENVQNGGRARLEAMRYIDGVDARGYSFGGVQVNIGVNIQPGYIVDAAGEHRARAAEILQQSGSVKNALDDQ